MEELLQSLSLRILLFLFNKLSWRSTVFFVCQLNRLLHGCFLTIWHVLLHLELRWGVDWCVFLEIDLIVFLPPALFLTHVLFDTLVHRHELFFAHLL